MFTNHEIIYFLDTRLKKLLINKIQKGLLRILRDVPQIEAFRTPVHVELTDFTEFIFDLLQNCAYKRAPVY